MDKFLYMLIERDTIVKIDGQAKQLNTNLTIKIPEDFLLECEILDLPCTNNSESG